MYLRSTVLSLLDKGHLLFWTNPISNFISDTVNDLLDKLFTWCKESWQQVKQMQERIVAYWKKGNEKWFSLWWTMENEDIGLKPSVFLWVFLSWKTISFLLFSKIFDALRIYWTLCYSDVWKPYPSLHRQKFKDRIYKIQMQTLTNTNIGNLPSFLDL